MYPWERAYENPIYQGPDEGVNKVVKDCVNDRRRASDAGG